MFNVNAMIHIWLVSGIFIPPVSIFMAVWEENMERNNDKFFIEKFFPRTSNLYYKKQVKIKIEDYKKIF